ncbi:MAG: succinate dehydrogenase, hydrophobic membrane anchor protein [Alphaproteobacteria bacterium]|nr:succinate dehydrogenase, hydrophobic membrane anchor protein [Alphaproteobacteria bacterium]
MAITSRMRSPLGRAIGLGSAKEGVEHWWALRITSIALVPLTLWFVIAVIALLGADRTVFVAWLHHPLPAVLMILVIVATFYHAALGLQVVIEDYLGHEALRISMMIVMRLAATVLAALGIFAVLKLSLGA